jgi:cation diffusion facilitator family transporter
MNSETITKWEHEHSFGQDKKKPGEFRTIIVIVITTAMMMVEIAAGIIFGSMALLADGLHMASHAAALGISVFAYVYARKHAHDKAFSFGTGKVNALGGFTGAVLLVLFAFLMVTESIHRLVSPVAISFNQAIIVAVVGLIVNGASVFILGHEGEHHHHGEGQDYHHHDHNLRAAYFHVLADALTSVLAIVALLAAKYYGLVWMDPLMGIVGAILVTKWSVGLLRQTSGDLLDKQGPETLRTTIRERIESVDETRVVDFHLWSIGPNIYATAITIVTPTPMSPEFYKELFREIPVVVHSTVEIHQLE